MAECETETTTAAAQPRELRLAVFAPTPTPYRALEFDQLARAIGSWLKIHLMFLEGSYQNLPWSDDVPHLIQSEVLPRLNCGPLRRAPGLQRVNVGITRRLNALRPDLLLLHGYDAPALWLALRWARRNRRPILYRSDSNGLDERERKGVWKTVVKRGVVRWFLRRMDAFLTIGTANEDYLTLYGAPQAAFFRTGYQADTELHGRGAREERDRGGPLRAELGIRDARLVLFVGRFVPAKGILDLVAAFKRVRQDFPDVGLLLIGTGPQQKEIETHCAEVREHVYFCGFLQPPELARAYGIGTLLALPSTYEPWGVVVNEAMAAGLPVIASHRVGAVPDLVIPGVTGATFRAGNVEALTDALHVMLAPGAAERCGARARELVFDWTRRYEPVHAYKSAIEYALRHAAAGAPARRT